MIRSFLLLSSVLVLVFFGMSACNKAEQKAEKSMSPQEQSAETAQSMEKTSPEAAKPMEGMKQEPGEMTPSQEKTQEEMAEGAGYGADVESPEVMTKTKEMGETMEESMPEMPAAESK